MKANTYNIDFLKALKKISYFFPYQITDEILEAWAEMLNELEPEITTACLTRMLTYFATDQVKFDKNIGIKNICNGFVFDSRKKVKYLREQGEKKNADEIRKLQQILIKYSNVLKDDRI